MKYTIHQHSKQVIILTEKLIIDVRTREEYYQNHIKDALNIPLHDLHFYHSFLQNKQICVYCNSGTRAEIAHRWLTKENITVEVLPGNWQKDYPRIKNTIISAVNYLEINPDKKEEYQELLDKLFNDIRIKCDGLIDGDPLDDWIVGYNAQYHICIKIDNITAYLATFL